MNELKKQELNIFIKDIGIGLVIAIIFSIFFRDVYDEIWEKLLAFYIFFASYFGYKSITYIQPKMFVFMSIFGWIIYFLIKLFLAILVGIFIFPVILIKNIMCFKK